MNINYQYVNENLSGIGQVVSCYLSLRLKGVKTPAAMPTLTPVNSSIASSISSNTISSDSTFSTFSDKNHFSKNTKPQVQSSQLKINSVKSSIKNSNDISVSPEARRLQQQRYNAYLRSLDSLFQVRPEFVVNHIPHSESGLGNVINGVMTTAYIAAVSDRSFHSNFPQIM